MVRNSELRPIANTSRMIAAFVRLLIETQGYTQDDIGKALGRAQSYASLRIKGLKPWTVDELEILAQKLGCKNAFVLVRNAQETIGPKGVEYDPKDGYRAVTVSVDSPEYRAFHVSDLGLAAKHGDTDAEREAYEEEP